MSGRGMVSEQYHNNLATVFDKHINCEFEEKDVEATMQTMVKEPYVSSCTYLVRRYRI